MRLSCKFNRCNYIGKSEYKYVYIVESINRRNPEDKKIVFRAILPKYSWSAYYDNLREAAIAVDKKLLDEGKNPINIFKKL